MTAIVQNIVIPQSESYTKEFYFRYEIVLARDLYPNVSTPPTNIRIEPSPVALPTDYVLSFNVNSSQVVDLVTSSPVLAGATNISVKSYTGTFMLKSRSTAPTLPIDLTGQRWTGGVKKSYSDQKQHLALNFNNPGADGKLIITATKDNTSQCTPNAIYADLPQSNFALQFKESFDEEIWKRAYFWDASYSDASGANIRKLTGRCWIPWS